VNYLTFVLIAASVLVLVGVAIALVTALREGRKRTT